MLITSVKSDNFKKVRKSFLCLSFIPVTEWDTVTLTSCLMNMNECVGFKLNNITFSFLATVFFTSCNHLFIYLFIYWYLNSSQLQTQNHSHCKYKIYNILKSTREKNIFSLYVNIDRSINKVRIGRFEFYVHLLQFSSNSLIIPNPLPNPHVLRSQNRF